MIPEGAMVFYNSYIDPPILCDVPLFYEPISKKDADHGYEQYE
jgi:hypothetical protein